MIDVRSQLARNERVPQVNRTATKFITIHWNGPAVHAQDLDLLKADARYHAYTRGWDGLAYHYAVGRTNPGEWYQCRDHTARLNHSGVTLGNQESLAVLVITGEGQTPPPEQLDTLRRLVAQLLMGMYPKAESLPIRYVLGHRFWPRATACPGAALTRWLDKLYAEYSGVPYKGEVRWPANVRDEPSVLSHLVGIRKVGTKIEGVTRLANPVKGDALWVNIGNDQYIHGSALS